MTLREFRKEKGWNVKELAKRARVSRQTIYLLERGRVKPQPATAYLIAQALGVEPAELGF